MENASADWGNVGININVDGGTMRINGKPVEYGIGTHANSVIHFELPEGYDKFVARAGIDNGGSDQGMGSSVQFFVYTQAPPAAPGSPTNDRTPEERRCGTGCGRRSRSETVRRRTDAAQPVEHRHRPSRPRLGLRSRQLPTLRQWQ